MLGTYVCVFGAYVCVLVCVLVCVCVSCVCMCVVVVAAADLSSCIATAQVLFMLALQLLDDNKDKLLGA